jgi:hypothetical protein
MHIWLGIKTYPTRRKSYSGLQTAALEFIPSFPATWEERPAIGQGRLFGEFDPDLGKPPKFEKWYESLTDEFERTTQKTRQVTMVTLGLQVMNSTKMGAISFPISFRRVQKNG